MSGKALAAGFTRHLPAASALPLTKLALFNLSISFEARFMTFVQLRMKRCLLQLFLIGVLSIQGMCSIGSAQSDSEGLSRLMPRPKDSTSMWWRDGFAGIIDDAAWRRITQAGNYWLVFDSDTVKIPRLGPADNPVGKIPGVDLSLKVEHDGKTYTCRQGSEWSKLTGPRLIESGRFLQRTDVNGLVFTADDGSALNAEARFETVAWADQLGLTLAVRPGVLPISPGEKSPGRVGGGFGLTGDNHFEVAPDDCHTPNAFTLCFWAFVPKDFQAGRNSPWLVCKNSHEAKDGNYGIVLSPTGVPSLRFNRGGGKGNAISSSARMKFGLRIDEWNHVAISYDGDVLRLLVNGNAAIEKQVGTQSATPPGVLAFGRRQDGSDGYPFRGVIDEIFLFDRALDLSEVRLLKKHPEKDHDAKLKPMRRWTFRKDLPAMPRLLRESWKNAKLEVAVSNSKQTASARWKSPFDTVWDTSQWEQASLMIDPLTLKAVPDAPSTSVVAIEKSTGDACKVTFEPAVGWHRINLDGVDPIAPAKTKNPSNDAIERIQIKLANPTDSEQVTRLMFEKTSGGIRQRIGQPITGISACLRDTDGNPTGIPVQLSKNWHSYAESEVYSGLWLHGVSQVRLPPRQSTELELTISYGHWGGVAAASHAQLCLIGWGYNQLWEQSALGSWGESICYNPEQVLGKCNVTDVRPLMVKPISGKGKWGWTNNVGGADYLRLFDPEGERVVHSAMRSDYQRTGPCLTEVHSFGRIGKTGISNRITSSLSRTDDLVRATYRIRMDVKQPVDFSRFVIFQTGADTYAYTHDKKMAVGNQSGLIKEWNTEMGGDIYRGEPIECTDPNSWATLYETSGAPGKEKFGWANRGIMIRQWKARLGGEEARPWIAEHGADLGRRSVSTIDIVPPPEVKRLKPGDYIDATIEFVVVPQSAADYYGPNESLRAALAKDEDTWKMTHREAIGGELKVDLRVGILERLYPGVTVAAENESVEFDLQGGLGYVPLTFTNLTSHRGYLLTVDGKPLDQAVHGNDFWQTDYDDQSERWSQTYNVPASESKRVRIKFGRIRN